MHGKERVTRVKGIAVGFSGFIRRHTRLTVAVVVAALLVGPLLLTSDGEVFFLNAVGLGFGALLLRRFVTPNGSAADRQRTQQEQRCNRRRGRNRRGRRQRQHNTKEDTMTTASNADWWDWDKVTGQAWKSWSTG